MLFQTPQPLARTRRILPTADQTPAGVTAATVTPWPAANLALGLDFIVPPAGLTVFNLSFDANVQSGNYDLALYTAANVRIASKGSTVMAAGFNTWAANQALAPGQYKAVLSVDNAVAQIQGMLSALVFGFVVGAFLQSAGAFPLPDPFVPAGSLQQFHPFLGLV